MALRVRVAASAFLVASGLIIGGAGGAMALADPGDGYGRSDDDTGDGSIGDIVRHAFSSDRGNGQKASESNHRPQTRWGNGRQAPEGSGDKEPPKTETSPTEETTEPAKPTTPCPESSEPSQPPGLPAPTPPQHR